MACRHKTCQCEIEGCGITHPANWTPPMHIEINGIVVGGDDPADCVAHWLLSLGYPRNTPEHLRAIAESHAAKHAPPAPEKRIVTQK